MSAYFPEPNVFWCNPWRASNYGKDPIRIPDQEPDAEPVSVDAGASGDDLCAAMTEGTGW